MDERPHRVGLRVQPHEQREPHADQAGAEAAPLHHHVHPDHNQKRVDPVAGSFTRSRGGLNSGVIVSGSRDQTAATSSTTFADPRFLSSAPTCDVEGSIYLSLR